MSVKRIKKRGSVLVYVVLTIAAILSTTLAISTIVISSLRQTRFLGEAQAAFYSAESGMENSLFLIRKKDKLPEEGDCGVGTQCEVKVETSAVQELNLDLAKDQSVQIDLYNPDDLSEKISVESIGLTWQSSETWLEISWLGWDAGTAINLSLWDKLSADNFPVKKILVSGGTATVNALSIMKNYRVRVKALYSAADDLQIKLYKEDNLKGDILAFPNLLSVKTEGGFRDSTHELAAELPRYAPISGLFDYVLFSEEKIEK